MPYLRYLVATLVLLASPIFANPPGEVTQPLFTESALAAPEWIQNRTVYEVNIRQYSEAGAFDAVQGDLDRIQNLGIGVIWLMPIHPIGQLNRKGPLGSYYSIADYYGINPEFGTPDAFRSLVEAAHARDIKVILDWVANHTAWDNALAKSHPDFYAKDREGNFTPPHGTDWTDVIQLDYANRDLWKYMSDAMAYWVSEYDIDGFRCDYAAGVPTDFWNQASEKLRQIKADLFLLAEAATPELNLRAFHASYGWPMHHAFNSTAQGKTPASKIQDQLNRQRIHFPANTLLLNFTTNHDENIWNGTTAERMGSAKRAFDLLAFTLPGIPLIYNGQEAGLAKRLKFFEKDPIDWSDLSESNFYRVLTKAKQTIPALRGNASFQRIPTTADEQVYAFLRAHGDSQVIVIANLSDQTVDFAAACEKLNGNHRELFSNQSASLHNPTELQLSPWSFKVFAK